MWMILNHLSPKTWKHIFLNMSAKSHRKLHIMTNIMQQLGESIDTEGHFVTFNFKKRIKHKYIPFCPVLSEYTIICMQELSDRSCICIKATIKKHITTQNVWSLHQMVLLLLIYGWPLTYKYVIQHSIWSKIQ